MTLPPLDFRRRWQTDPAPTAPPPHPVPEVPARDATPDEIPAGARRVIKAATASGWECRPTYARGTSLDRHGHPGALIHSLAVRMRLPGTAHRAVAVWTSPAATDARKWSADSAYIGTAGQLDSFRLVPLTAGLLPHLADVERLTQPLSVS